MTDEKIIELFFARDEAALQHTADKYENYCFAIANNILSNRQDSEECVNDTYLAAWQSIPPERPKQLSAYLGKIVRNFALTRHRKERAYKRGGNMNEISLELLELIPDGSDLAEEYDAGRLGLIIDTFLRKIKRMTDKSSFADIGTTTRCTTFAVTLDLPKRRSSLPCTEPAKSSPRS